MSPRAARRMTIAFFAAYTIALTYPGARLANRIEPYVLGLPFSMVWVVMWVVASFFVFVVLHWSYERAADREATRAAGGAAGLGGPHDGLDADASGDPWKTP